MLALEQRPEPTRFWSLASPVLALAVTVVIAQGRVSPSVPVAQATIEQIGEWMSGLWNAPAAKESAHAEA